MVLDAGMAASIRGVILDQDEIRIEVMSFGETRSIPWTRVHSMADIEMHPLDVYTRGQWMERVIRAYRDEKMARIYGRDADRLEAGTLVRSVIAEKIFGAADVSDLAGARAARAARRK